MPSYRATCPKTIMDLSLRPATPEHLSTVLQWITSPEELRLWGGELLTWPPDVEKTWREIGAQDANTFTLLDDEENIAGFGQVLARAPATAHLGRIIVSPLLRGMGVGRALCEQLIAAAVERHHPERITLNVYIGNTRAVALYRSLGFILTGEDVEHASYGMSLRVVPR